ncbi:MAG: hypothetical protein OXO49_01995 [Gammaproteobacteria bacterium]|nr:hypothetical protein [Gammaproteobacteria bacterium]MDE0251276.1 hypothetical protein [Gammaproteobacteria bacterium]MDE0402039.1 hypothetical protein [Gammaproteobacteria bacterium]
MKTNRRMQEAAQLNRDVEKGGVILGRNSELAKVAFLDLSADSILSRDQFVLGTKGLNQYIDEYSRCVGGTLYCLGTWHSHLPDSPRSQRAMKVATEVARSCSTPFVFLIQRPSEVQAFMAKEGN